MERSSIAQQPRLRAALFGRLQRAARQNRNLPCPVTSRTRPRCSRSARLHCTASRLAPVISSVIGAESIGHSTKAATSRSGVLPERSAVTTADFSCQSSSASNIRCAARIAVSIPSSQARNRFKGSPPARNPPPPPAAGGTKTSPARQSCAQPVPPGLQLPAARPLVRCPP